MNISPSVYIDNLHAGDVWLFTHDGIRSREPHMHICVLQTSKILAFVCATTKENTVNKHIKSINANPYTKVCFPSKEENSRSIFDKPCVVNCNSVFKFYKEDFLLAIGYQFKVLPPLAHEYFLQITNGICLSRTVEVEIQELISGGQL